MYENRLNSFKVHHAATKKRASNAASRAPKTLQWPHKSLAPADVGFLIFVCHVGKAAGDEHKLTRTKLACESRVRFRSVTRQSRQCCLLPLRQGAGRMGGERQSTRGTFKALAQLRVGDYGSDRSRGGRLWEATSSRAWHARCTEGDLCGQMAVRVQERLQVQDKAGTSATDPSGKPRSLTRRSLWKQDGNTPQPWNRMTWQPAHTAS